MFIEIRCPVCGRTLKVDREHVGKRGKCLCGHSILIQEPHTSSETIEKVAPPIAPLPAQLATSARPNDVAPPPAIAATATEKPKGFLDKMRDATAELGEAFAKIHRENPVTYFGGPYDLKPRSAGIVILEDHELVFKTGIVWKKLFRIPYGSIIGTNVDTAERIGKLRTVGAWALAGPLAAAFVGFGIKRKISF